MNKKKHDRRIVTKKKSLFVPFRPTETDAVPLAEEKLNAGDGLLAFERGSQRRVVLTAQAIYHHLIQGELAGEPYLVSY